MEEKEGKKEVKELQIKGAREKKVRRKGERRNRS